MFSRKGPSAAKRYGPDRSFLGVEPLAQFLAGLEEGHPLLLDLDRIAGARVAAGAGRPVLDRERAETAQFDAVAVRKRIGDLIEYGADNVFDIPQEKVRITCGND